MPPPGRPPYGYKRGKDGYVVDRAAVPVVREFFDHFLLYGSLRGAVRHIGQKFNKKISVSTGRYWLRNHTLRGDLAHQTEQETKIIRNTHKPIINREEAAQVDRLLRRNKSLPPRTASAPRSLAGLVSCASCSGKMTVISAKPAKVTQVNSSKSKNYLYLRYQQCPLQPKCKSIAYEQVLERVINKICQDLPQAVSGMGMSGLGRIKAQIEGAIAQKQDLINQLPALLESGILDAETADLRIYNLRTEMAKLEDQLAQLPPLNLPAIAKTLSIPQFWYDLSEAERRFYLREFIRSVQIDAREPENEIKIIFVF